MKKRIVVVTVRTALRLAGSLVEFQRRMENRGFCVHFTGVN